MTVSTRPESPEDEPFVRRLVLDSVALELGADSWPDAMRGPLLEIQYSSRRQSIRANYPQARSEVVSVDGEDAGWLVVAELDDEVHLVEIMIAPSHRSGGVGSHLIRNLLTQATKPVRLFVATSNEGAIRLYQRLGFRRIGGNEARHVMEYSQA